jgi:hypothetical protein
METLQAIQTEYRGYKFRSRLEARWAVFFDALGVDWEYESQGYQLSNGECYLPDFWLPNFSLRNEATTELVAARTKEASDRYHIGTILHKEESLLKSSPQKVEILPFQKQCNSVQTQRKLCGCVMVFLAVESTDLSIQIA